MTLCDSLVLLNVKERKSRKITMFGLANFVCALLLWDLVSSEASPALLQPDLDCNMESGLELCEWRDRSTFSGLSWRVQSGKSSTSEYTGPKGDHTFGNSDGQYLAMISHFAYDSPSGAVLMSTRVTTQQDSCLSFWYNMNGYDTGSLIVYKVGRGDNKKSTLFSKSGPQGPRWYRATVDTGKGDFWLKFEATVETLSNYGDIALDDIKFTYKPCTDALMKDRPIFDCDFEENLCGWYSWRRRNLAWTRDTVTPDTSTRDSLPPRSNGTSYALLVRKSGGYRNNALELRSPAISVDNHGACMSFWFKMDHKAAAWLKVNTIDYRKEPLKGTKTLFSTSNKKEGWSQVHITLPEGSHTLVDIKGEGGRWNYEVLAIDDIRLTRGGPCPKENLDDLLNCDFELDFCLWYMVSKTVEEDWKRTKDPTPTDETGPSHDHSGDGFYIFLDASKVNVAKLYSQTFNVSKAGACISFWYHMYGEDVYKLELAYKAIGDAAEVIVWSLEGSQEDRWLQQNVSLPAKNDVYLTLTAKRGYFPKGDIAVDDISISDGSLCQNDKSTTTAPSSSSTAVPQETTLATTKRTTSSVTTEPPPIEAPKLIVKGETNPVYYENSRVELVCQHAPDKSLVVMWYKKADNNLVSKELIDHHGEGKLVFDEVDTKDSAAFWCVVTREPGNAETGVRSNQVDIRVVPDHRASPQLEIESDGLAFGHGIADLDVDLNVKLTCGRPMKNAVYYWKTTSSAIDKSTLPSTRFLVLNGTRVEHTGVYSCRISKNGQWTSKSNELVLFVRKGKRCRYNHDCPGVAYRRYCSYDNRCECANHAVLRGRECKVRPARPEIVTYPEFHEFAIGESFYLVCKPSAPIPANVTFTFKHLPTTDNGRSTVEALRVLKITDAKKEDGGSYTCTVAYDDVQSYYSEAIDIQIKDFVQLSCDFGQDLCGWSTGKDTNTTHFVIQTNDENDELSLGLERSGPFIELQASQSTLPSRAILVSPTIEIMTLDSCLTFWYRMHGPDVHSLSVWKFSPDTQTYPNVEDVGAEIWTVIGDVGNDWVKANTTVAKGNNFFITFEAIGQAAIDDVIFTYRGGC